MNSWCDGIIWNKSVIDLFKEVSHCTLHSFGRKMLHALPPADRSRQLYVWCSRKNAAKGALFTAGGGRWKRGGHKIWAIFGIPPAPPAVNNDHSLICGSKYKCAISGGGSRIFTWRKLPNMHRTVIIVHFIWEIASSHGKIVFGFTCKPTCPGPWSFYVMCPRKCIDIVTPKRVALQCLWIRSMTIEQRITSILSEVDFMAKEYICWVRDWSHYTDFSWVWRKFPVRHMITIMQ